MTVTGGEEEDDVQGSDDTSATDGPPVTDTGDEREEIDVDSSGGTDSTDGTDGTGITGGADGVVVVKAGDLSDQTPQTPGLQRFEAVSGRRVGSKDLWMGLSVLPAGGRTGVHHHGRSETALYVLSGVGRWWVGDRLDVLREGHPGDFVYISPYVVHWEENASATEPVQMIVARTTQDAIVVNLEDHPHAPDHDGAGSARHA